MSYFPVRVTKKQQYSMYVEAEDADDALEIAAERLRHAMSLVDENPADDFSVHASVAEDEDRSPLETVEEALAANVTYVVDSNGKDVD